MPSLGGALDKVSDVLALVRAHLNDAQELTREIETPGNSGLARVAATSKVTVKTKTAHGFVTGQFATIANATDTSFNGTFEIETVPSTTTFTFAQAGAGVASGNGTVSSAVVQTFTDAKLMPYVGAAYRALQRELARRSITVCVAEATIDLAAGKEKLGDVEDADTALLPADFLYPWKLWERADGSTDTFQPMEHKAPLPERQTLTDTLDFWEYRGSEIVTLGATGARDVKLRYEKALPRLTSADAEIRVKDALDALAYLAAALAAHARGVRSLSGDLESLGMAEIGKMAARAVKPQQRYPVRRLPFSSRNRRVNRYPTH